ncbi:hypothetical protein K1719_032897 [Acacia pycnantha]|nr:hypothetical protein K1719_032897 [Acacia pycnantha]
MESALARILIKQYLSSLDNEHNSRSSSDDILDSFKVMGEKLKADSRTALTHPESVSLLCDLNNALADWQILKKKNKSIKRIFSRHDLEAQNELKAIHDKLKEAEKLIVNGEDCATNLGNWVAFCLENMG